LVTQEEVAEAVGVSRVWYAMLESGAALNASPRLLRRLADALSLSDSHREVLFRLALPELQKDGSSLPILEDLSRSVRALRTAARRVWSAASEAEVLVMVTEAAAGIFTDADFVGTFRRVQAGLWDYPVLIGGGRFRTSLTELHSELHDGLTPEQIDEVMLHGVLTQAGQVGTRDELHRGISVKHRIDKAFARAGFEDANFLDAHVRSSEGFEATIFANYVSKDRDFSDLDRSALGALADIASLALSR